MDMIRIMLVDDHDIIRTGLRSYLQTQPGMEVVAEARDGEEAVRLAAQMQPNIILMDITMPNMDGLEATRQLKSLAPESLVLALTVHEDKQYFMEMLAAGASGYLTKQAAADELVSAIRAVANGNVYLQPALARWLLDDYQRLANQEQAQAKPLDARSGAPSVVSGDSRASSPTVCAAPRRSSSRGSWERSRTTTTSGASTSARGARSSASGRAM